MTAKRLCPACSARLGQLIDNDCIICEGTGLITMGPAALAVCPPLTIAVAITLALESSARVIDGKTTLSDNRIAPLRKVVELLAKAGLITRTGQPHHSFSSPEETPALIAKSVTGIPPLNMDATLSTAPTYRYTENDRPNARGLPVLSKNGHPSALARLVDPATPGGQTRLEVRERNAVELKAKILLTAADNAIEIKQKRQKRRSK